MTIKFRDDMVPGDWRSANAEAGLSDASRAVAPLPSAGEIFDQAYEDARRVSNQNALSANMVDTYDEVNARIKAATKADIANPMNFFRGPLEDPHENWKKQVNDLRAQHPDALPWDEILTEPERRGYAKMKEVRDASDKQQDALGLVQGREIPYLRNVPIVREAAALGANLASRPISTLAQFAGGFAGSMTSPLDAGVNLLGFGAGGAAKSLLKNAVSNAAVNAVGQMPLSYLKQEDYRKAGLPTGFDVWLSEVEGAAAAGAVIDAGVRGPVRAMRALKGDKGLGGVLFDAVPETTVPAPKAMEPISPETFKAAQEGDLKATREILTKTGAIDNPEIRGALEHAETHGRLDADALKRLEEMGVAPAEGMRIMDGLVNGRYVRPIDVMTDVERMRSPQAAPIPEVDQARVLNVAQAALDEIRPQLSQYVAHAIDARIPEVEALAKTALARLKDKANPADVAREFATAFGKLMENPEAVTRMNAEVRIASGAASSVEIAQIAKTSPELRARLNPEIARHSEALALSTLDDANLSRVLAGEVPPSVAAHIADHVPADRHAQAFDDMVRAKPQSMDEAIALLDELVPTEPREPGTLDRAGGLDDPIGAEAKARTDRLKQENAEAVKAAMEPIKERDKLDSKVESLKGEIAKLDEKAGQPQAEGEFDPFGAMDGETKRFALSDKDAITYAKKRGELHEAETKLAEAQARLNPDPEAAQALYRVAMASVAERRSIDVYRAVAHAVALGRKIAPEGTKIDVRSTEMRDDTTGNLLDAYYEKGQSTIVLARYAADPAARMSHEVVHALVDHGLLTAKEMKLLADEAAKTDGVFTPEMREKYAEAYKERANLDALLDEEAAAHLIDARMKGKAKGPENTVEGRIAQFVQRLRNLMKGYGFKTADDVTAAILNGEIAAREQRFAPLRQWMGANDVSAMAVREPVQPPAAERYSDPVTGFTLFPLTDKVKQSVKAEGQVMFAFAGERAKTADREALARAKQMDAEGTDRTKIWNETGWFKGVDGKWRFEIDDSGAQVFAGFLEMTGKSEHLAPFKDRMAHFNYLQAYPEAASINVQRISGTQFPERAGRGAYDPNRGAMWFDATSKDRGRSIALHELQHDAQRREGFQAGATAKGLEATIYNQYAARINNAIQDGDKAEATRLRAKLGALRLKGDIDTYRRLAGEVEARAVQKRLDYTPEQRRSRPPWEDYDVPEDQQIVRFADGQSVSQHSYSEPPPVDGPAMRGMTMFAIRAFHGSPHDFDRFDLSKIGTGEGAQAYGHGLYFAENEGVAKQYRDRLGTKDWRTLEGAGGDWAKVAASDIEYYNGNVDAAMRGWRDLVARNPNSVGGKAAAEKLAAYERGEVDALKPGRMYEVNIKADPNDFLDWDKPLSQQSDHIRKSMTELANGEILPDWNGMQAYRSVGSQMMSNLDLMSPELSKRVRDAGIPGVKYLDQGSRTGVGEGTSNYVVFDDNLIEIVAKDGKPIEKAERQEVIDGMSAKPDGAGTMFAMAEPQSRESIAAEIRRIVDAQREELGRAGTGPQDPGAGPGATRFGRALDGGATSVGDGAKSAAGAQPPRQAGAGEPRLPLTDRLRSLVIDSFGDRYTADAIAERRKAQFPFDAWHGTTHNFDTPNPFRAGRDFGFHVAVGEPLAANRRLGFSDSWFDHVMGKLLAKILGEQPTNPMSLAQAKIMPLAINASNSLRLPDLGKWDNPTEWRQKLTPGNAPAWLIQWLRDWTFNNNAYSDANAQQAALTHKFGRDLSAELERRGYDSIIYKNDVEANGKDSLLLWDARRVRSAFDAFDERARNDAGLRASDKYIEQDIREIANRILKEEGGSYGQIMFAMADQAEPRPILETEYAAVDRLTSFKNLIEACAA